MRELGLTREIPRGIQRACANARRHATVRVVCPELIPDVPLSKIEGLRGSPIVLIEERRF
jgi:hypothetical protein